MTDKFIQTSSPKDWFGATSQIYVCQFSQSAYCQTLFQTLGISYLQTLDKAVVSRKAEYLAGRFCAKNALALLGHRDFNVSKGAHGEPLWPPNIVGAISHSGPYAVASVCSSEACFGLGVDIEQRMSVKTYSSIQGMIVFGREASLLTSSLIPPESILTIIFSLKESFFKAAFPSVGRYFDFDAVSVIGLDLDAGTFVLRINEDLADSLYSGMEVRGSFTWISADYVLTYIQLAIAC